jgi:hypothetical protein
VNIANAFPGNSIKEFGVEANPKKDISPYFLEFVELPGKKLGLNKTNMKTLEKLLGQETDHWKGRRVTIGSEDVFFQGQYVPAVRVRPTLPAGPAPAPATAGPAVAVIGPGNAAAMAKKIGEIGATNADSSMPNLEKWLNAQPGVSVSGEPATWPVSVVPHIKQFIADRVANKPLPDLGMAPSDDIPF